jgi:hypothetical protein
MHGFPLKRHEITVHDCFMRSKAPEKSLYIILYVFFCSRILFSSFHRPLELQSVYDYNRISATTGSTHNNVKPADYQQLERLKEQLHF